MLARRKWFGRNSDTITAVDFDALLGHSVVITDAATRVFAAEIIAMYPDAKVILNIYCDVKA